MINDLSGFENIKKAAIEQHKNLTKMFESIASDNFGDKLRDIMYEQNKQDEKKGKIKNMTAKVILTKTGEVVFKFDDEKNGKVFFDTIK